MTIGWEKEWPNSVGAGMPTRPFAPPRPGEIVQQLMDDDGECDGDEREIAVLGAHRGKAEQEAENRCDQAEAGSVHQKEMPKLIASSAEV